MRVIPISLFSQVKGLIRRRPSSLRYMVPALSFSISRSEKAKEGNFDDCNVVLELNEVGVLRVLTTMKDDPYLALSFLKRIESNGALPSVYAYAALVRIVCSWGLDEKLNQFLVEFIGKGDQRSGFSVMDLLKTIVEAEVDVKLSCLLLSRVSCALVKAYAKLAMFDEAMNVFWEIELMGLDADAHTYVAAVRVLYKNKDDKEGAESLVNKLLSSEMRNPRLFYMTFIEGLCLNQMADVAHLLLRALIAYNVLVDKSDLAIMYHRVVRGLCYETKIEEAESAFLDMEACGIVPDVYVFSAIIEGHRRKRNVPRALEFFIEKMMQKNRRRINCVIVSSVLGCYNQMGEFSETCNGFQVFRGMNIPLDRLCYNAVFEALGKLGQVEEALKLFREMTEKGIAPDIINFTTLIGGFCQQGKCYDAIGLLNEMEETGIRPDTVTYNVLAGGLARNGLAKEALSTLELMETRGVKPTSATHNMVIQGLIVAGKIDEAEALYGSLEHKSGENEVSIVKGYCEVGHLDKAFEQFIRLEFALPKNVYFTLFTGLCAENCYIGKAQELLERMWKLGVEPGKNMYGKLIGAWCRVNNVRKAKQFLEVLFGREIIPDLFTFTVMINTYCRLKKLKQANDLFIYMQKIGVKPDVVTCTVLLNSDPELCPNKSKLNMKKEMKALEIKPDAVYYTVMMNNYCRSNDLKKAKGVFNDMKSRGIKPDVVTYTVLLNTDPELNMKKEMKELDVKPDVVYYTALINWQCKIPDLEEAEKMVDRMIESGVKPDAASYTAIIAGWCKKGCLYEAKKVFDKMIESGVKPDLVSYTTLIAACYRKGYASTAKTLMQEMLNKGIEPTKTSWSILDHAISKAKALKQ
ncbi:unnamed protein product [Cochlearia groenlandica]